jgi:hypothetical protein
MPKQNQHHRPPSEPGKAGALNRGKDLLRVSGRLAGNDELITIFCRPFNNEQIDGQQSLQYPNEIPPCLRHSAVSWQNCSIGHSRDLKW